MPLYEYGCKRCAKRFEVLQKFSDEPLKIHENCGGEVERLLSAPALQFKGTGWYVTDYARPGASAANGDGAKKDSKSDAKPDSSASTSGPPKTETKSTGESKPA